MKTKDIVLGLNVMKEKKNGRFIFGRIISYRRGSARVDVQFGSDRRPISMGLKELRPCSEME